MLLDPTAVIRLKRTLALLRSRHVFPRNEPLIVCAANWACKGPSGACCGVLECAFTSRGQDYRFR
jgi:hypothetical protein